MHLLHNSMNQPKHLKFNYISVYSYSIWVSFRWGKKNAKLRVALTSNCLCPIKVRVSSKSDIYTNWSISCYSSNVKFPHVFSPVQLLPCMLLWPRIWRNAFSAVAEMDTAMAAKSREGCTATSEVYILYTLEKPQKQTNKIAAHVQNTGTVWKFFTRRNSAQ